jgi:NADPH:quinone reductase-like Zn-dependent oxidoreductase
VAHKPVGMAFEEAAAVCDGATQAFSTLRAADVRAGQRILVYGASGSLGTAAVQLAHQMGAHVTAVCNTDNVELVRSLGADEVIDYLVEDFAKNGQRYDAIIDAVGKYSPFRGRRSLKPTGTYVATDLGRFLLETLAASFATKLLGRRRVRLSAGRRRQADVELLKELIEGGKFRAVIDRRYPLERVADAHRYVESWQKVGNVVLSMDG